jgi:hypothetical protein
MDKGLAVTLVFGIIFGWFSVLLIIICLWVLKGDFKSSYNYRPWKPFVVPEDLADKANREGARWLIAISVLAIIGLILGVVYGLATGDYFFVPFIVMPVLLVLLLVLIIGVYLYSWLLLKRRNAGKI